MPKLKNYQEIYSEFFDRILTEKEIRLLRKFTGIAGQRIVDEIILNPNHKWRNFVLDVWWAYNKKQLWQSRQQFHETICDVEPKAFDSYWYMTQGQKQKKTFRTNTFDRNMDYIRNSMNNGRWVELPIVWRVETELTPYSSDYDRRVRIDPMNSYVVASSRTEASSVWATMVLSPLGLVDIMESRAYSRADVRFVGPHMYCDVHKLNSQAHEQTAKEIQEIQYGFEECLKQIKEISSVASSAFAMASATLAATNG